MYIKLKKERNYVTENTQFSEIPYILIYVGLSYTLDKSRCEYKLMTAKWRI